MQNMFFCVMVWYFGCVCIQS